ncbi:MULTISPECIES: c-type cytochrome [unclassified Sphingobium]|uniref:c-type cytochrome n=1 Tax=unclassified Sphingobium TaxID=2611147 RepID=UPI0022241DB7|nr:MULTISPECIES: cytochrome c [unclassified Sphingobium]MCW2349133.1 mono/diheme cytochrome c family protein [Sphingobium sp. B12D2B]MCW2368262.1 mono/diheme cytochrome c family protein [Sphingobium sp. B11D3D]
MNAIHWSAVAALIIASTAAAFASSDAAAPVSASTTASATASTVKDGRALFLQHCGYCHLPGGTGTIQLERRWGKERALLAERTDLPADYVKAVARHGLFSMPPITRVEVTDDELEKLAAFLAMPNKDKAQAR